jgi:hypothetical protein
MLTRAAKQHCPSLAMKRVHFRVLDVEIDIHGKVAVVTTLTKIVGPQALSFPHSWLAGTWSASPHTLLYGRRHRAPAAHSRWEDRIVATR